MSIENNNSNEELLEEAKKEEKQVLYFILKDIRHFKEIFEVRGIGADFFTYEFHKKIINIVINYYNSYGSLMNDVEFEREVEKLDESEHNTLNSVYRVIKDLQLNVEDEDNSFNRIVESWINIESTIKSFESFKKNKHLLDSRNGIHFIESMSRDLENISTSKKDLSSIEVSNWILDSEQHMDWIQERHDNKDKIIRTHIAKLDEKFIGFEEGQLTLVVALAGVGKSTFMMNLSRNIFQQQKKNVLIVSLEMPKNQWMLKLDAVDFKMRYFNYKKGTASKEEIKKYREKSLKRKKELEACGANYTIFCAAAGLLNWEALVAEIEKRTRLFVPDIIFIDYLALIDLGKDAERRDVALGELTKKIRSYARKKKVPIVLAAQAGRNSESKDKNGNKKVEITVTTIEDSNKIGQHIDNGIALTINQKPGELASKMMVHLFKHRDGDKAEVELDLNSEICFIGDDSDPASKFYATSVESQIEFGDEIASSKNLGTGLESFIDDYMDDVKKTIIPQEEPEVESDEESDDEDEEIEVISNSTKEYDSDEVIDVDDIQDDELRDKVNTVAVDGKVSRNVYEFWRNEDYKRDSYKKKKKYNDRGLL